MDFARAQLEKYGWKDGEGLGANKSGISKAIKPGLKKNRLGLGADPSEDFTNSWWQKAYNTAAQNIEIIQKDTEEPVKVTLKSLKKKKKKKKKKEEKKSTAKIYSNFVKAAVLDGNKEIEQKDTAAEGEEGPKELEAPVVLSDEQLLAACGGRTAHKAARHGHKLSGKLARLQQQDAVFKSDLWTKQ